MMNEPIIMLRGKAMEQKNRFGEFIANLRREKQISLEQLSEGLCNPSMLSRFERGEREPEKLMQDRFLTRLGAVPENYENFLYYNEYCRWEKRQGILHNILEENIAEAKTLLAEYHKEYDMTYALEYQFYLAMHAQILRQEGAGLQELATVFKEALELTVPDLEKTGFANRALSLEEINLLLEYVYCSGGKLAEYEEILAYIEKIERTMLAMAKVYPKAVYYYYESWEKQEKRDDGLALRMWNLGDKAIEILRDANRMFYLWELFGMKERLMPLLPEKFGMQKSVQERLLECRGWRETLEEIYQDYGVTIGMYEFCYLYVGSENYCIGDVIRIRRKMLGLSQRKLCEGLCDERTVSRLERNKRRPQREVVQCLFDRLNLSTELNRTELVTDSQEAIEIYKEARRECLNWNYKRVEELISKLKTLIDLNISSNVQAVMRDEILNQYKQGKLEKGEYVGKMKEVLECTVPYKAAISFGEKYLTNEEIACLQNITLNLGSSFKEVDECIESLIRVCENPKYPANYVRMYEFIMGTISSCLGDKGEYDYSDRIKSNIIRRSLKNRRMGALSNATYGILWNEEQRANLEGRDCMINVHEELKICISIGSLSKDLYRVKIYESKLRETMSVRNKENVLSLTVKEI